MRPIVYGIVLLTSLTLMGCSMMPEPKVVTVTKTVRTEVPVVARPKQVHLNDVKIYVVSKKNYKKFVKEYEAKNGADSYIALSVKDYENLSLNFAELRRYIENIAIDYRVDYADIEERGYGFDIHVNRAIDY